MLTKIPFGRLMLFFIISAALFGLFSLLRWVNPFFRFYGNIAVYALIAACISFVLWLTITLFIPKTLIMLGRSIGGSGRIHSLFCDVPWARIAIISFVVSLALSWLNRLVFPIGFTSFIMSVEVVIARMLFFIYGSSANRD